MASNSPFGVKPYEGPFYQAVRNWPGDAVLSGDVNISARGANRTTGFHTSIRVSPLDIFPPQLDFVNIPPTGIVLQVLTPFYVHLTLKLPLEVRSVTIHDTEGSHIIPIEQPEV